MYMKSLRTLCATVIMAMLACLSHGAANSAVLVVRASSSGVDVGESFSVSLGLSGLSADSGDSLSGFDFALSYDAAVASLVGFSFVDAATGINQLDLPDPASLGFLGDAISSPGSVRVSGLSGNLAAVLDALQADAFDFITLTFLALAQSPAAQFAIDVADPTLLFVNSDASTLAVDLSQSSARVAIGQVPEPSSTALLLAALAALLTIRRRVLWKAAAASALLAAAALGGTASAAGPTSAPSTLPPSSAAAPAASAVRTAVAGTVVEVKGQRMKIKSADGSERWVSSGTPLTPHHAGKRVRGDVRPVGDTVLLEKPLFD